MVPAFEIVCTLDTMANKDNINHVNEIGMLNRDQAQVAERF